MMDDERILRDIVQHLQDAWNKGNAADFSAPFADDAVFIHIYGGQIDGRAAIEFGHRLIFDGIYKGSRNQYTVREIRFPRPDVALVLVEARLQFEEEGQARLIEARPTMVAMKDAGRWVIHAFQNTRITELPNAVRPPGGGRQP